MSEPQKCKACGAAIWWCRNASSGKNSPMDAEPVNRDTGWTIVKRDGKKTVVFTGNSDKYTKARGFKRYTPHFETCPNASEFRRKK